MVDSWVDTARVTATVVVRTVATRNVAIAAGGDDRGFSSGAGGAAQVSGGRAVTWPRSFLTAGTAGAAEATDRNRPTGTTGATRTAGAAGATGAARTTGTAGVTGATGATRTTGEGRAG